MFLVIIFRIKIKNEWKHLGSATPVKSAPVAAQRQRFNSGDGCRSSSSKASIPFYIYMHAMHMCMCGFSVDLLVHCLSSNLSRDTIKFNSWTENPSDEIAALHLHCMHAWAMWCSSSHCQLSSFRSYLPMYCGMVIRNYCRMEIIIISFNENAHVYEHICWANAINNLIVLVLSCWRQFLMQQ